MTSIETPLSYYDRDGREITTEEWVGLRLDESYRLLRQMRRCCHCVSAEWVGVGPTHIPKHVFQIRIEGGRFDGAILHCRNESEMYRVFDHTIKAVNQGKRPWWLEPILEDR